MSNYKQSSIDLFIDQLEEKGNAYEENEGGRTINISIDISDYMELKIQAKAMHKEEIIKAYKAAMHTQYLESHTVTRYGTIHKADDYYNKTYGDEQDKSN